MELLKENARGGSQHIYIIIALSKQETMAVFEPCLNNLKGDSDLCSYFCDMLLFIMQFSRVEDAPQEGNKSTKRTPIHSNDLNASYAPDEMVLIAFTHIFHHH